MTRSRTGTRVTVWAVLAVIIWLAIGGVGGQFIGKLSSLQKNDSASFLPASAESTKVAAEVSTFSDSTSLPLLVVVTGSGKLSTTDQAAVQKFAASLPGLSVNGATLSDYLASPQAIPIPSKDGQAEMVVLSLATAKIATPAGGTSPVTAIADAVHSAIDAQLTPTGLQAHVTGPAGYVADLVTAFGGIDGVLLIVALVVVLVILLVVYRSPVLPIVVLLTAVFGLAAAGFVVYQVADKGWITVSGQSQGILSILVVGASPH